VIEKPDLIAMFIHIPCHDNDLFYLKHPVQCSRNGNKKLSYCCEPVIADRTACSSTIG